MSPGHARFGRGLPPLMRILSPSSCWDVTQYLKDMVVIGKDVFVSKIANLRVTSRNVGTMICHALEAESVDIEQP